MDRPWIQNYDPDIPLSPGYPILPLDHYLLHAAHKYPQRTATIFGAPMGGRLVSSRLSYRQLNKLVNQFAAGLQQTGVKKGDRVAVALPNCPQFMIAAFAVWRVGGVLVILNPFTRSDSAARMLQDSGSETLVAARRLLPRIEKINSRVILRTVIPTRIHDFLPWPLGMMNKFSARPALEQRSDGVETIPFAKILDEKSARLKLVEVTGPETAVILYPQPQQPGVALTQRNLVSSVTRFNQWLPLEQAKEIILAVLPFAQIFSLLAGLLAAVANAATIVLLPNPRDVSQILKTTSQYQVTFLPGVPKLFAALLKQQRQSNVHLNDLRLALSGNAFLPPAIRKQFESTVGCRLLSAYGLTEASGLVAMDPYHKPNPETAGVPIPDTDVQITDTLFGTRLLPIGEIGEIVVRGPQVMPGFWRQPELSADKIRFGPDGRSGWLYTGDIGFMDAEGYIHITTPKRTAVSRRLADNKA